MTRYDPGTQWRLADPEVVAGFVRAAVDFRPPARLLLALFEAGIVESNLRNLPGGDRDSVGALQQRAGWGPVKARRDPYLAALAFLREGVLTNRTALREAQTAGELAQAIQRSAYPDRYDEAEAAARYAIERATGGGPVATWHLAPSLKALFAEIDARWPKRDRSTDGTVGDTSHAARESEHNPDRDDDPMPRGAVSAADITKDSAAQMTAIRLALVKDDRVWYVIHNGRIYSRTHDFASKPYTGANKHVGHLHVSLRQTKQAHDDTSSWGIARAGDVPEPATPEPTGDVLPPTLERGTTHALVSVLKRFLGGLPNDDEKFGPATEAAVKAYQRGQSIEPDGIVGPVTWGRILTGLDLPGYKAPGA